MPLMLILAAFLLVAIAIAHSYLGERYILRPLFKGGNLPEIFGGTEFTIRTLRFAWHLTSLAWCGFAGILIALSEPAVTATTIGLIIGITFLAHFAVALFGSRGKHLSWVVFLLVGLVAIYTIKI